VRTIKLEELFLNLDAVKLPEIINCHNMEHTNSIFQHEFPLLYFEINQLNIRILLPKIKLLCFMHVPKTVVREI
jgi:hypothetical protein